MEGSSSPIKIDFTPLKLYFERLDRRLKHPALLTINDHVTLQVQQLMVEQEVRWKICGLILRIFFHSSIVDDAEITANNWQELAALLLILCWFTSEQEKLEKNLAKITDIGLMNGVVIGELDTEDLKTIEDSSEEKCATFVKDLGTMIQRMETLLLAENTRMKKSELETQRSSTVIHQMKTLLHDGKTRMEKSKLDTHNEDGERSSIILTKACWLDNRIGPLLLDLFCVLKMYGEETIRISNFLRSSKKSLKDGDEIRFVIKIVEMLNMADNELKCVEKWWSIYHGWTAMKRK